MGKMSSRGHKKQLVEQQARTAADLVSTLDDWRDLAYRQRDTIRKMEADYSRLREMEDRLVDLCGSVGESDCAVCRLVKEVVRGER